jgi:hypothetical protein
MNNQEDFLTLTHLLHKKNQTEYNSDGKIVDSDKGFIIVKTEEIEFSKLEEIYKKYFGEDINFNVKNKTKNVYMAIIESANCIDKMGHQLENKIILAIAIRLEAEKYLKIEIKKINKKVEINKIKYSQFGELHRKYKNICETIPEDMSEEKEKCKVSKSILNRVSIMTPENIHLNSFMYEPILDMDIVELKNLYNDVKEHLKVTTK